MHIEVQVQAEKAGVSEAPEKLLLLRLRRQDCVAGKSADTSIHGPEDGVKIEDIERYFHIRYQCIRGITIGKTGT